MSGDTEAPPTYYFSGITFNPSFYQTSDYLVFPIAQGTETISTLKTSTIYTASNTLNIGSNGSTGNAIIIGSDTNTQTNIKSTSIGLFGNTTVVGNLSTTQTTTANSYNFLGTTPTLTKTSLGYYFNYPLTSASYGNPSKYLYSPSSNGATTDGHYLYTGVYIAHIYMYIVGTATTGTATYTATFNLGASNGTSIQTMPVNSQYGTMNIATSDFTATNGTSNLNNNGLTFSHSGCFTLSSNGFVNLEFNLKTLSISNGTLTYNLYGCIHRIA